RITGRLGPGERRVRAVAACDDLGGRGTVNTKALSGILVSALGPEDDPTSRLIADHLAREGIAHRPIRTAHEADWTLLVSSGPFGDKLAVGFRGCHSAMAEADVRLERPGDLVVVASLTNRLA